MTSSAFGTRIARWTVPAVLAIGTLLSIIGGILADRYLWDKANDRLNALADMAAANLAEHAAQIAGLTRALQASFLNLPDMQAEEFREFVDILRLHAGSRPLQSYIFAEHRDGDLIIRHAEPPAARSQLPDLRRSANPAMAAVLDQLQMEGALLATLPAASEPGGAGKSSLIFLAPIHYSNTPPRRYVLKNGPLAGAVAITVSVDSMLAPLAAQLREQQVRLRISATPAGDSSKAGTSYFFSDENALSGAALYATQRDIDVQGTQWHLTLDAGSDLILFPQRHLSIYAPAIILTLTLLLAALAHTLVRSRRLAERHAELATRELRKSEARFRDLTELSSDWYWEQDAQFRFTHMSVGIFNKSGVSAMTMIGKTRWEMPIEGIGEDEWAAHRAQLERHEPFHDFIYRMRTPDKGLRWFVISGRPVFDAEGQFAGYRGTGRDITERHQSEDAALRQRRLLEAVMESLPVGVWLMDDKGQIVSNNPAGQRIWAGSRYVGVEQFGEYKAWWADSGREILPEEWAAARAFGKGETSLNEKIVIQCFDGSRKTILNSALPLRDEQGRITGAVIVNQDIDALERAQQEIRQLNEGLERRVHERTAELEASNRELEAFSYSVSHDLRAPLRGIDGFALILAEDYGDRLDEAGRDYLQRIRLASQRLSQTIDDMIELARITRAPIHRQQVDVSALASTVALDLEHASPMHAQIAITPSLVAQADPALLRIVLQNLLDNARKFTAQAEHPHIEIGSAGINGEQAFFVRDNGAGFDPAYAGKLFQPFQRLHHPDEFSGTGIGLASVKRIIERHGGRVWAESQAGQGATFWFTLP